MMVNVINPKDFLLRLKRKDPPLLVITPTDVLEIVELGITIPISRALDSPVFYDTLKKAVSDFNADAALNENAHFNEDAYIDFDDLYTRYWEYVEVLKTFIISQVNI